jgi:metal-responsive CopG/Arc/MetJ family transcriptional regulator
MRYLTSMEEPKDQRIIIPMPKSLVDEVDDYRFKNRIASRSEAVRELLQKGLHG